MKLHNSIRVRKCVRCDNRVLLGALCSTCEGVVKAKQEKLMKEFMREAKMYMSR